MSGARYEDQLGEARDMMVEFRAGYDGILGELRAIGPGRGASPSPMTGNGDRSDEPLLAFIHVPKTAGATVISMFAAAYSKQGISDAGNYLRNPEGLTKPFEFDGKRARKLGRRVMAGHVPYSVLREQVPPDTRWMTFLRDPVERVLSHYYRHILAKDNRVAKGIRRPNKRRGVESTPEDEQMKFRLLEEALVEARRPELRNLCTRFLCDQPKPLEELPASAIDEAKENLRGFAFVGIQERFEESVILLQRMLSLGEVPYEDRHVNTSRPSTADVPKELRELIAEHNQFDLELHRFGLELMDEAIASAGPGFADDVEALRARDADAREKEWLAVVLPSKQSGRRARAG